ncbi:MAG TPA: glyoxylate/hydroxypyruvate reductase A, partial [Rhizomicrobium sp.]|nr:glyoxylate/hydroxypyruvate reductase A [Rhizomicrobium sp.]
MLKASMRRMTTLLAVVPPFIAKLWTEPLTTHAPWLKVIIHGQDEYAPENVDYALGFRPPPGLFKTLPKVKAIFSLGAGVDGFLADPEFPKQIPLVRFVDHTMSREMTHYVVLQTLLFHRTQRLLDAAQKEKQWRQAFLPRRTEETRVGILGLGEIGTMAGERLRDLDFPVAGWSRTKKSVPGIESFAGEAELPRFLARSDILICLLPLTPATHHILNAKTFAQLPQGAFVINAARGGHLVEADLVAALNSGHLAGAALDVFETEPLPQSSPIWSHPKITMTPHVAAMTDPKVAARSVADSIARHMRGETLDNLV